MRNTWIGALALLTVLVPGSSQAAGFRYADNGARALGRAGAFVALPTDATAFTHNPAGLARLEGIQVQLEGNFVWLENDFQRFDATNGSFTPIGNTVSNAAKPGLLGLFALSYEVLPGLTIAAGAHAPPSLGQGTYPDPRNIAPRYFDGTYQPGEEQSEEVFAIAREAPQRYDLIEQSIILAQPSLAVAWAPLEWLSVGITGQLMIGNTKFSKAIQASPFPGPQQDVIAEIDVWAVPHIVGIFGIQVRPVPQFTLGASYRPGFDLRHTGTLDLVFNDALAAQGFGQSGNDTEFLTPFPGVLKMGAGWQHEGWLAEVAVAWEDWSRVDAFTVTPDFNITGPTEIPAADVVIPRNWEDTWGVRVGGSVDLARVGALPLPITLRAGYAWDPAAIPDSTLSLDFPNNSHHQISTGVSFPAGPVTANIGASWLLMPEAEVRDSVVRATTAAGEGQVVGNGNYDGTYFILIAGVQTTFGGTR